MAAAQNLDVLADVLAVTRLGNSVLCRAQLEAPWGLRFEPGAEVYVHIVARGTCWLKTGEGEKPQRLIQGDVAILPRAIGHALVDSPDTPALPVQQVLGNGSTNRTADGQGDCAILVCGRYRFDYEGRHPLLAVLPAIIHITADEAGAIHSLQSCLVMLLHEFDQPAPGSSAVISRLLDTLLVFVIRAWLARQGECTAGWLGALRDPKIGRALSLMHQQPERSWSVAALASEVSMSRATFASRFTQIVGEAPVAYLTRWRMDLGARLLRDTARPVYSIAEQVGYQSETAFSKAFRRARGTAPRRYRVEKAVA